jgi:hypothetical protein
LNVGVEWVAILTHIPEVPDSNLGKEFGYPEVFHGFSQYLQAYAGIVSQIRPGQLCSTFLPIHHLLILMLFDGKYSELLTAF